MCDFKFVFNFFKYLIIIGRDEVIIAVGRSVIRRGVQMIFYYIHTTPPPTVCVNCIGERLKAKGLVLQSTCKMDYDSLWLDTQ